MWNAFMADWEERYGGNPITAAELCENALNKGFLDAVFERANSERSRSMAFGRAIAAQVGKVRSGRRIERGSQVKGIATYRLVSTTTGRDEGLQGPLETEVLHKVLQAKLTGVEPDYPGESAW
jgi:hypothetical protein